MYAFFPKKVTLGIYLTYCGPNMLKKKERFFTFLQANERATEGEKFGLGVNLKLFRYMGRFVQGFK